jgi:dihydroxyacetone kinase
MAFGMAAELAQAEGIVEETVLAADDVVSAPQDQVHRPRGIAGIAFAYKIAGAKAETGASLAAVSATARKAVENTRSMGVALSPCTIPAVGRPNFCIGDDEMELGMGIHGEPGLERGKLKPAAEIAETMVQRILPDLPFRAGDRVAVLVNGLGATPMEELFILFDTAHDLLREEGLEIHRTYIGEYATSMEMAGCSISLLRLDEELQRLLDAPAYSPFLLQWG